MNSGAMVLIDAYSQIFRAFYAIAGLTNSKGEPTNALYGFTKMLLKMERDYPSSLGAVVFDCGRVQFRQVLNPEYKANRKPTPEELKSQVPVIREMAAAFGWPLLEENEFEADDLIAALAIHADCEVRILSSDKDLSQLIDDRIIQILPDSRGGFMTRDRAEVLKKFEIGPELIVDYLSLLGDASDNIPGVPGVGPKTAVILLNRFGALPPLLDAPDKITDEKLRAKLLPHLELLKRNRALITLRQDLPEKFSPPATVCRRTAPDYSAIRSICERMELKSILKELDIVPEKSTPPPATPLPTMFQDDLFGNF